MVTVEEVRLDIISRQQRESPDSANHATNATREEKIHVAPEKLSEDGHDWQKYGLNNIKGNTANANREENIPLFPEKPSEDGYNWRKYGQKNIKGTKHIRSYYRCSYQKCLVKKQVEHAPDGRITDTSYFGNHDHPKPQTGLGVALPSILSAKVQTGDGASSAVAEDNSTSTHALTTDDAELMESNAITPIPISVEHAHDFASPSSVTKDYGDNDDNVASKRRKTGDDHDMSINIKHNCIPRWVVETVSAVDIVNDGYRWRKYGQKLVKDNPNARSYYRCTNPGCPAKKRVERASNDSKVVLTTYESHHVHDVPQGRTLFLHSSSPASSITPLAKPKHVIQPQSTAAICKEVGNTTPHTDEKDNAPEKVNVVESSAAKCNKEEGPTDRPAEKDNPTEEVGRSEISATIKQEQVTCAEKKDFPATEVKGDKSSAVVCMQEQGNTIDHSSAEEVDQAESSETICKQEQGNTCDDPAEKTTHKII